MKNAKAFTLIEVMISSTILGGVVVGLLQLFIYTSTLGDLSGNMGIAISEAQSKMDQIRNTTFASIATNYSNGGTPGDTFTTTQIDGTGTITIDSSNPDLLGVTVDVSFENKDGRTAQISIMSKIAER